MATLQFREKGTQHMKTCLTFAIRNGDKPLHLCYESEHDAVKALRGFAQDIDSIPDGETVFVEGDHPHGRVTCVGFLKRDFVSIQKDSFDDEDDREEAQPSIGDESELIHYGTSAGHAVEAAKEIVKAVTTEQI